MRGPFKVGGGTPHDPRAGHDDPNDVATAPGPPTGYWTKDASGKWQFNLGNNPAGGPSFGAGGGSGGPGGSGGGPSGSPGSLFGPGGSPAANSAAGLTGTGAGVGGAAGAGAGGTMAATGGSWWKNPNLWGAVLGAGSSYLDAQAAGKAGRNAGKVDISSSRTPWEGSEPFILEALSRGNSLLGRDNRPAAGGGARPGGGGGGGGAAPQPIAYRSAANADALTARASGGHPLYGASNDYVSGTLGGGGADANRYRTEAAGMFGDLSDPNLNAFISALTSGGGIGRGGGGGGGGGGFSATGPPAEGPVGAAQYIKDILNEKYLTENPHSQAVIEAANRRVMEDFAGNKIPGVNTKYAGAGALGSEAWNEALRRSTGAVTDSLADNASSVLYRDYNDRMGDLMQALGLGTQLDISTMDDATRRAGIASSAGSAANSDATRMRIAELGALSDAIGSSVDLTKTGALGMAGLADLLSEDQRFALGMVPDLTGMDVRDLESAFGANYAIDELGLADRELALADRELGSRNANANANRNWQRYVYEQERPWNDLLRQGDLIAALTGGFGTSRETGMDQRNVSPYTGSPVGQAVAGGLAGWAMGDEWRQRRAEGGA